MESVPPKIDSTTELIAHKESIPWLDAWGPSKFKKSDSEAGPGKHLVWEILEEIQTTC